jgi:hypothetical protein
MPGPHYKKQDYIQLLAGFFPLFDEDRQTDRQTDIASPDEVGSVKRAMKNMRAPELWTSSPRGQLGNVHERPNSALLL